MAPIPNELAQPLSVVDALFAQHVASGKALSSEFGERDHFVRALGLDDEENFARIPCLNDVEAAEMVPPFSLVRYRGMVQDTFEPEFYSSVLQELPGNCMRSSPDGAAPPAASLQSKLVTTKYRECSQAAPGRMLQELEDYHTSLGQRGVCYMVPLPGETAWAREASAQWTAAGGGTSVLLPRPAKPAAGRSKRRHDEDVDMDAPARQPEEADTVTDVRQPPAAGRRRHDQAPLAQQQSAPKTADEFGLNFPIPAEERRGQGASTACLAKLYDQDIEALRVCAAVEVVGVLCVNPELAEDASAMDQDSWHDARHPSTALVPRLHVIALRQLPFHHPLLPFSDTWLNEARLASAYQQKFSAPGALAVAREAAVAQLKRCCGGDALAAEYLLMLLVSRSFKNFGDRSLGSWSLNLHHLTAAGEPLPDLAVRVAEALSTLAPRVVRLEVTPEALNSGRWRPRKDYVANRIVAGQLQLSAGTVLVLDETKMQEGNVTEAGVQALQAVQSLVANQSLRCDFAYQQQDVELPLEVLPLVVSRQKSLLKDLSVQLPVVPDAAASQGEVPSEALAAARWMLALVTRAPRRLQIPDEVTKQIAEDFQRARGSDSRVNEMLCHTWLSLARARCLTFGEQMLSLEHWRATFELEQERLRRGKATA